ncbi:MAG: serine hydrolase domain-containing protein [Verrucomicrobiales bacterium]
MGIFKSILLGAALLLVGTSIIGQEESRSWTSKANGRQFKGAFVKVEGDAISIRSDADNVVFQVKKSDLIQADWDWITENYPKPKPAAEPVEIEDLSGLITGITASIGTPVVGVLLVKDGKVQGIGVNGIRKVGSDEIAEPDDKWHLGSCTKSLTATLAATFVEEGAITWETTISEVLGKDVKMLEDYETVTLGTLLANRSGLPKSVPNSVYGDLDFGAQVADLKDNEIIEGRTMYVEAALNLKPVSKTGSAYEYSNSGFVVVGAMLEKISGKPWEKLIEERIYKPLEMENSGFGNAAHGDKNKPTQPWPHANSTTPVGPEGVDDNGWVIGPAGTAHCSLKDTARYITMQATREVGPVLKQKETYEFLHTAVPQNNNYARGWIVTSTAWAGGPALTHDGSNTMNHCSFWVAPETGNAVAAFTDCAEKGRETCMAAVDAVVRKYLK